MANKKMFLTAVLVSAAMALFAFTGCSSSGDDQYMDESEITLDYLYGEFPEQLVTDGAEIILGSVEISEEDGKYTVTVTEKEVVQNEDYEEGYYIAETNAVEEYGLGGYAKLVYTDDNGENIIGDADGYIENHNGEPDNLYTVYQMNGTVELMLPVDPSNLVVQF